MKLAAPLIALIATFFLSACASDSLIGDAKAEIAKQKNLSERQVESRVSDLYAVELADKQVCGRYVDKGFVYLASGDLLFEDKSTYGDFDLFWVICKQNEAGFKQLEASLAEYK